MRKEDIQVTTPEHSTIYAIGTRPESNDKVWANLDTWDGQNGNYRPGYVLEVRDSGFATVLTAKRHPDSPYAAEKQASLLEATSYSLEDVVARRKVMTEHSHWSSQEERKVFEDAIAELKPIPEGWHIQSIRTTYVRMLWADYSSQLTAKFSERKIAVASAEAAKEAKAKEQRAIIKRLTKAGVGFTKKDGDYVLRWVPMHTFDLKPDVVAALLEKAGL